MELIPLFPEFRRLDLDMFPVFKKYADNGLITVSDISFTNMFAWDNVRKYEFSMLNSNIIILITVDGEKQFLCPIGKTKINDTVIACLEYLENEGYEPVMRLVSQEIVNSVTSERINKEEDEPNADYLYRIEDLTELKGTHYANKRNDINHVLKNHQGQYRLMMPGLIKYCKTFAKAWFQQRNLQETEHYSLEQEYEACVRVLDNFSKLHVFGGVLFIDGEIKGFTIADMMSENMALAHFEKGERDMRGVYSVLWWGLAKYIHRIHPAVEFINREQDLGVGGMRNAKENLHPFIQIRKYTLRLVK